jgi:hypothetical protein
MYLKGGWDVFKGVGIATAEFLFLENKYGGGHFCRHFFLF